MESKASGTRKAGQPGEAVKSEWSLQVFPQSSASSRSLAGVSPSFEAVRATYT